MGKKHKKHHKKRNEEKAAPKPEEPPIKLVLKVGHVDKPAEQKKRKQENQPAPAAAAETHKSAKEHSSKKKKKRSSSKDRKKRKHDVSIDGGSAPSTVLGHDRAKKKQKVDEKKEVGHSEKPVIKKIHIKPIEPPREHRKVKPNIFHDAEPTPVTLCLSNLHQTLQRKDVNGFFTFPVNDVIAPGYSSIITNPMDFSTIKMKIDQNSYTSLEEYRDDFNLMCNNAMIYNTPETIYFKAAKKLQQVGGKLTSADKFRNLYRAMGIRRDDEHHYKRHDEKSSEELIDVDTVDNSSSLLLPPPKKKDSRPRKKNTVSQRLQAKAEEAARKAAEKLAKECPNSNIGFLRKDADGNTTLAILNPCSVDSAQSLPVNLGNLTGKLSSGSVSTSLFQEDKKNKATPVTYLQYGPFSSFSPTYDSSNATITKEDSDLLYHTYGDSTGTYYAQSIQAFVKDNLFAKDFVDSLLDSLTAGAHSKLMSRLKEKLLAEEEEKRKQERLNAEKKKAEEKKKSAEETAKQKMKKETSSLQDIDFGALMSLEKDGIDMSFLKNNDQDSAKTKEIQAKLDKTADLLAKLDEAQSERLSQPNDSVNGATPKSALQSSDNEQQIAQKLTEELAELTAKVQPKRVVDTGGVRKAMGVGDISESARKLARDNQDDDMEVHLAAEAIETVFNETTTMEDLDKVICEAAREVEDAMGLDVLDDLTASLDDVKRLGGI